MGFGLVYPLMTELFAGDQGLHMAEGLSQGTRYFYLGLSFLLYPLAAFFGAPLMGDLARKWGKKGVLLLCMGGITFSFFLMGVGVEFFSIPLLLIGRGLSGIMAGSQPLAQEAIIQARPRYMKGVTAILSIGIVLGPLIGGIFSDAALVPWFTLSTPFYLAALLGFVATFWIARAFPSQKAEAKPFSWARPLSMLIQGFKRKETCLLALVFLCMQIGFSLFFQLIQIYVSTVYAFQSWEIGLFNGYMGVAFALVVLVGMKVCLRKMRAEKLAFVSLLLTGVCLILPVLYSAPVFLWIMAFLVAGFDMIAYGSLMITFSHVSKVESTGFFAAALSATWAVTGFALNLIPSLGLRGLIAIGALFLFIAALLMMFHMRQKEVNFEF